MAPAKRIDVDDLKSRISLEALCEQYGVKLQSHGTELKGLCPFHNERTPSFTVTPAVQKFHCFGCGASGDHIQFLQDIHGHDFINAAKRLQEIVGGGVNDNDRPAPVQKREARPAKNAVWQQQPANEAPPCPAEISKKIGDDWVKLPVVASWPYRDANGTLLGYACRIEPEPGKKDIIPMTWRLNTETGEVKWKQLALDEPRTLYGAELLAQNPTAPVILVEGEKAADAARVILDGHPHLVLTWPGGGKAVKKANWELLRGRVVAGWPDCDSKTDPRTDMMMPYCDQPGISAMLTIAGLADAHGFKMKIVAVPGPGQWADGWDLADGLQEGWDAERTLKALRNNLMTADEIRQRGEEIDRPAAQQQPEQPADNDNDEPPHEDYGDHYSHDYGHTDESEPFRILGWDRGSAYYLPHDSKQVVCLTASAHTKLNLLQLAPLAFWDQVYSDNAKRSPSINWDMAADSLMKRAKATGIFNPDMIRGRGAWWDGGKVAVHLGDRVIIEGVTYSLKDAPTEFVYEAAHARRIAVGAPLPTAEAVKLVQICESLRWERPISGTLLAGWVFLAPVCGALEWRPHIWVTGGKGSGKSTVMKDIVGRSLNGNMLFVQGDTSEAGVRQELGQDAIPVLFDEFESERRKSAERTEDVLSLVTAASSETGAVIAKGGATGKATKFKIRSMFAFSGISVQIKQAAAISRITVLSMRTAGEETAEGLKQYQGLMERIRTTMTPDYIDGLQARAVQMIPVIRKNAQVFAEAAAVVLGTRRQGDQIGTLLAGAYALHSNHEVTPEFAKQWLEARDWSDEREDSESTDEMMCLQHIMTHQLIIHSDAGNPTKRTIGELIHKCVDRSSDMGIGLDEAKDTLDRHGIKYEDRDTGAVVIVANRHKMLNEILRDTQWMPPAHARILLRLRGAQKTDGPEYFKGTRQRGVEIPIAHLI